MLHKEFAYNVQAPEDIKKCQHSHCKRDGDFKVTIIDDRAKIQAQYQNICDMHVLIAFIEYCNDPMF